MFTAALVCALSFLVAVLFFWQSFGLNTLMADPGGPALVPRALAVVIALAALLEGAKLYVTRRSLPPMSHAFKDFAGGFGTLRREEAMGTRVFAAMILSLVYPYLIQQFGFVIASAAFVAAIGWLSALALRQVLVFAIVLPVLMQLLFGTLLGARIPRGALVDVTRFF